MVRYSPFILAVLLIAGLTYVEGVMTDRLAGTNVSAEQRAELLEKVPKSVGDWHGEDTAVDENVRKTAGAIGAVQREYHNVRTGEKVRLWLIVGHAREVSAHTPDICYPSQGFEAVARENSVYTMVVPDQPNTEFLTNTFLRNVNSGQQRERVFWNWYNPMDKANEGKVVWEAPSNARWHFGNTRALYKMYFSSSMRTPKETADESACVRFARDFLPEVNKALTEVYSEAPAGDASATKTAAAAAKPKAEASKTEAAVVVEPASPNASSTPKAAKAAGEQTSENKSGTDAAKEQPKANP